MILVTYDDSRSLARVFGGGGLPIPNGLKLASVRTPTGRRAPTEIVRRPEPGVLGRSYSNGRVRNRLIMIQRTFSRRTQRGLHNEGTNEGVQSYCPLCHETPGQIRPPIFLVLGGKRRVRDITWLSPLAQ